METRQKSQWCTVRESLTLIMEWLKENSVTLIISLVTLVSSYTYYGYRISALETHQGEQDQQIATLTSGSVTTQVALAQINTKLEYISAQLAKLTN